MNDNGHSCYKDQFKNALPERIQSSGLHTLLVFCRLFRPHLNMFRRMRRSATMWRDAFYHVPIYERQPCTLASISLCSLIAHAFYSPPLHRLSPAFPFLTVRAVNADKRYPLPRLLPSVSESKNSVINLPQR